MNNIQSEIEQLNIDIITAHNKHYESSSNGLIIPNESPNGNTIYHLYSDGEITCQKGGWAYLSRNEFLLKYPINGYEKISLQLPKKYDTCTATYAILTDKECLEFRVKMVNLIEKMM
jgi:hypothetical protein